MAQHFKVDNASKIKDSQVVRYVQAKVDTGEIKPAVVKQAVQKVDAAPEVKSKAAEPKQDVKPEIKKDEPKKAAPEVLPKTVKVDEPKPEIKKAAPDELDAVKKNAGVEEPTDGLSKFSLKNGTIKFGMSEDDFRKISSEKLGNRYVFDVAGIKMTAEFKQGVLVDIMTAPGIGNVMDFQDIISKKFGKPSKENRYVAGPNKGEVGSMEWSVQDVVISIMPPKLNPTTGRIDGVSYGSITPKALVDKTNKDGEAEREKKLKDF
jgi:hypothetical protein